MTLESWISSDANQNRTTGRLVAENAITNGQIEFYCATIENQTMRIYVNGQLVAQKEGNMIANVARSQNFIGHSNWCFADPDFKGFMDEVRLYNRALTAEEIRLLYESPALVTGPATVCVGEPAQLEAQGGVRYEWSPTTFLDNASISNPIAMTDQDTTITYQVEIFFPDNCSITDSITLTIDACLDCAGVSNGSAVRDDCGECLQPDDPNFNQSCIDCAGVVNGNAVIDSCGQCLEPSSPDFNQSCVDCAGIPNGNAVMDDCGECHEPDSPDYNQACLDCAGVPNGTARLDDCGACLSPNDPVFNQSCIGKDKVYVPNAFSPNNDGFNDELGIYGDPTFVKKMVAFEVKDRWGTKVFEFKDRVLGDSDTFWDGKVQGKLQHQGVYLYQLIVEFQNGKTKTMAGTITLIY